MDSPYIKANIRNLVNRIKLSESEYLFLLFESLVNSIQAIKEKDIPDGKIDIFINRIKQKQIKTDNTTEGCGIAE